ncbi:MAG TPA: hypothetical protein VEQ10_10105 [Vicinamibacteria bacterium]|nr:hypothetical protein [Vicinamibacteria bacterium]
MRRIASMACLLVLGAALALAADADVSGKWKISAKGPRGERTFDAVMTQTGEKLTVKTQDRQGNDITSEGTVKGGEISWVTKRQTPNGEFVITYKGKVEGKTMSGTTSFGSDGGGTGEWKAEKAE